MVSLSPLQAEQAQLPQPVFLGVVLSSLISLWSSSGPTLTDPYPSYARSFRAGAILQVGSL